MLKYVTKFTMDILPSVVATIIGAYIVNHYIVTKPAAEAPVAAAVSPAVPNKATSADAGNLPEPGVKAKGISEKAMLEQTAAERPTVVEKSAGAEKSSEKPVDRPAETASIPADHRHPPAHDKAVTKSIAAPVATPPVATPAVAVAPVEAAAPVEEHRDANELARAAIERLRGASDSPPRAQEAARAVDAPRVAPPPSVVAPVPSVVAAAPPVRPLPPPITVSTPPAEPLDSATGSVSPRPNYPAAALDDPHRPTPPADIPDVSPLPSSGPLDLRAEVVVEPQRRQHTNVAEDVLLAARSVFHAVLPK